ncbi:uncharacterized protein LOC110443459 [Mizuhopecten yessoensis]|uniref:uncharacterized protein LOC110443459 n=1 Tax=Mizuhopecten yessoensis TaxID=6573 RepID=UPI000B45EC59|nr:uncharacterized protein LOC110443459 [Mizuhopecten yessoensis]
MYPFPNQIQPQIHHPNVIHFIGAGYDLLKGNPDGGFWDKAGDDPGLKITQKIFYVTQSLTGTPPQIELEHRDSCFKSHEYNLIYNTKSYQDRLREAVTSSGDAEGGLSEYAFTLSSGYKAIAVQTARHNYIFQDYTSFCNMGHARLKLHLAQSAHMSVTNEFAAATCQLPTTYDQDAYVKFIQEWGTHVITEVEVGKKLTYRYQTTLSQYINFIVNNASDEISIGGPMNGFDASLGVDMESFKYRNEYRALVGKYHDTLGAGDMMYNDEIELVLLTLDGALKPEVWTNFEYYVQQGVCSQEQGTSLSKWRANILKALAVYPRVVGASTPTDSPLAIPITWPSGTYGLPKPISDCPGHFNWTEGYRKENTETTNPNNTWSADNHFAGALTPSSITFDFCMKPLANQSPYSINWTKGDYCIYKYGSCPFGFMAGTIHFDDENTNNQNSLGGDYPDGTYSMDTTYSYCCRSDGSYVNPIILPTDKPFYLFKNKRGCQHVHGMVAKEEYVRLDNEDMPTSSYGQSSAGYGPHPAVDIVRYHDTTSTLHFCYYSKAAGGPGQGPLVG